jgi:hypothetical protein
MDILVDEILKDEELVHFDGVSLGGLLLGSCV